MTIGLLEDNESIREVLRRYLELEGWSVQEFPRRETLEDWMGIQSGAPGLDLIVLDVMLPDGDGFLMARNLRQKWPTLPFLFVTARAEESDRITGLELGAEDYIVKPFSNREVVLRIKGLLRRAALGHSAPGSSHRWAWDGKVLEVDEGSHEARLEGRPIVLTAAEWSILLYLTQRQAQLLSRAQILQHCLQSVAEGSERTVDTHVKNLRHKLQSEGWIETVRGFGYRFAGKQVLSKEGT